MGTEIRYFNFPIQLLNGFLIESKTGLNNILAYALYEHCLKLDYGTDIEKMNSSAEYFNVKLGNTKATLSNGRQLYNSIPGNPPKVGLNTKIFWDYMDNEKTEFDKVQLLGFLACKSILQNKPYWPLNNRFMWARMDGKPSPCEKNELSVEMQKYANHYQARKLKVALEEWGLQAYSCGVRGFFISINLTLDKLAIEVEKRKKSNKEKEYKMKVAEARRKALEQLNNTKP